MILIKFLKAAPEGTKLRQKVSLQIVGMERLQYVAPERSTVTYRQPPNLNFSQAANRRKSLNAVMLKSALDLPQQHRPGWNGQRFQITNVDIVVEPGWTVVPLSVIKELKVSS